jgi:hypothetical protein
MMNPFKQFGDLNQMRKQAMELQKQLQEERIEQDEDGVKIIISGEQKIIEFESNGATDQVIKDKLNKALKSSQEVAARKLSSMTGGLQGLLGK